MGWLKGKSRGNHRFSMIFPWFIWDFPVHFPLNQSIEYRSLQLQYLPVLPSRIQHVGPIPHVFLRRRATPWFLVFQVVCLHPSWGDTIHQYIQNTDVTEDGCELLQQFWMVKTHHMGVSKPIIIHVSGVNTHLPAILLFTRAIRFWPKAISLRLLSTGAGLS